MRDSQIPCTNVWKCQIKYITKILQFNLASFPFIIIGKFFSQTFYLYSRLLYSYKICYLSFCSGDVTYLSPIFTWLLQRREATLTKSLLLHQNSNKYGTKSNFLLLNVEAILTYWSYFLSHIL